MTFLALCFFVYFAPSIVASSRQYPQAAAIWFTNFFLGWTGVGWIACLVWALSVTEPMRLYPSVQYITPSKDLGQPPGWHSANGLTTLVCGACFRPLPGTFDYCASCGAKAPRYA